MVLSRVRRHDPACLCEGGNIPQLNAAQRRTENYRDGNDALHNIGRGSAEVDTVIDLLLRDLDRRADAVRVGQRCTTLARVGDATAVVAQPAGEFRE